MSEIRWEVYPDLIPLNGRPTPIGDVLAPDKPTAIARATALHGPRILVQSAASRKVAERELVLPLRPTRTREEAVAIARLNAERTRRRKLAAAKRAEKAAAESATPDPVHAPTNANNA